MDPKYALLFILSAPFIEQVVEDDNRLAMPKVNQEQLSQVLIAVPPLAEQHRIVARVDELMGLLDRLEAARTARDTTRAAARDAALAALREADTAEEVEVAWNRFAERMDDLVCEPVDIKPVRQAVLQLAVRGKLVPQNPEDVPASVLLERIAVEKARLYKQKAIRKPKTPPPVPPAVKSRPLPRGWEWVRFGAVYFDLAYGTAQKCRPDPSNGTAVLRIPNIDTQRGTVTLNDLKYGPLTKAEIAKWSVAQGQILVIRSNGSTGLVGRAVVVPQEADGLAYAGYLMRIRMMQGLSGFARIALETPEVRQQIEGPIRTTTGVKNVNSSEVGGLIFPLPPLAEQHRIVVRVDELMSLLDRLEARLTAMRDTHGSFARAATHHLDS